MSYNFHACLKFTRKRMWEHNGEMRQRAENHKVTLD